MKTAISIPDKTFKSVEKFARQARLSRSAVFTQAVTEFLDRHRQECVTEQLNRVYEQQDSGVDAEILEIQTNSISREDW